MKRPALNILSVRVWCSQGLGLIAFNFGLLPGIHQNTRILVLKAFNGHHKTENHIHVLSLWSARGTCEAAGHPESSVENPMRIPLMAPPLHEDLYHP